MSGPRIKPFQLLADHPALELVNTLDMRFSPNPEELLPTYQDLLRLAVQLGLVSAAQARKLTRTVSEREAQRVLASAVDLREALAGVLYARIDGAKPPAKQLAALDKQFQDAARQRRLRVDGPHLAWGWAEAKQRADIPLWKLAQAACDLLVSGDAARIKDCSDPTCRWLFLDLSKNHTRRWCDMKICGNRMKARKFQARLQHEGTR